MSTKVIKFWAPWCGPCRTYAPIFEKVKQDLTDTIEFAEINADEDPDGLTSDFKVKGIPCTVIIKDGVEVARQAGSLTEEQLREFILVN